MTLVVHCSVLWHHTITETSLEDSLLMSCSISQMSSPMQFLPCMSMVSYLPHSPPVHVHLPERWAWLAVANYCPPFPASYHFLLLMVYPLVLSVDRAWRGDLIGHISNSKAGTHKAPLALQTITMEICSSLPSWTLVGDTSIIPHRMALLGSSWEGP